jgi:pre-mRNA-splicing factor ATP-dependent RNA helicase DHX38/PRP16
MARQREQYVQRNPVYNHVLISRIEREKANKIAAAAATRTPRIAGAASGVAMTPRSKGIGAGARSGATPRRRGGGI